MSEYTLPSDRLTSWTPGVDVGVPGGIDQYRPGGANQRTTLLNVTQSPYNADNTGSTDATTAIQAAIDAASAGQVVYIPAGTYRINGSLGVAYKDNITIRGDGPSLTHLISYTGGNTIGVGGSSDYTWSFPNADISGSPTRGTTVLSVADTSNIIVGAVSEIRLTNYTTSGNLSEAARPVLHVSGFTVSRRQKVLVTAKTSSTVTITPGLMFDTAGRVLQISRCASQAELVGIEDLHIDASNTTNTDSVVYTEQTLYCWIYNVKVEYGKNYNIKVTSSFRPEVRKCYSVGRNGTGSNGGALVVESTTGAFIEDNILRLNFPFIEVNTSVMGSVFAYNFCHDLYTGQGQSGSGINSNHAPHNSFNLYEGNIANSVQADGFYGSVSEDTFFRNWFSGVGVESDALCVNFNRFSRNYSLVGNVLGSNDRTSYPFPSGGARWGMPNIGNFSWTGEAQPSTGDWWADMPGGVYPVETGPGSGGWQELDLDVEATLILKANYNTEDDAIPAGESLSGQTLANSWFRTSKPSWFGNLTWPPIDSSSPGTPVWNNTNFVKIPAGYRYVNGQDPPADNSQPAQKAKAFSVKKIVGMRKIVFGTIIGFLSLIILK